MGCLDSLEPCDHRSIDWRVVRCSHPLKHNGLTNCVSCESCQLMPRGPRSETPNRKKKRCKKCLKDKKRLNQLVPGLGDAAEKVIDVLTLGHGHELGRMIRGDE